MPLDLRLAVAAGVIENRLASGSDVPDLALAVARGDFAIALQAQLSDTTDILKFVVPPIEQQIANAFLPDFTELIYLTQ